MSNLLVVMLGCALGGAMRYLITTYINKLGYFPYGTLAVNLIGCFLIGMIATLLTEKIQGTSPYLSLFLTVGFLGGLTTFSSFTNETLILWRTGDFISVLLNVGLNTFGGLLAAWIGRILIYKGDTNKCIAFIIINLYGFLIIIKAIQINVSPLSLYIAILMKNF